MHALVAARDADGDRLRLVLDGVDRPGQLLDRPGQREHEVVDERGRRADLARARLVLLDRALGLHVAQQPGQAHGRARLEVAVVAVAAQPVDVLLGGAADLAADRGRAPRRPTRSLADGPLDDLHRLAQRPRRGVDGQRRLVAEQVAGHRRQHEPERRVDRRHRRSPRPPGSGRRRRRR